MMTKPSDRLPPYSEEAERAVIGAMILDPERVIDLCLDNNIGAETFYTPTHRELFGLLVSMRQKNTVIDLLTICTGAKDAGKLEQCGGEMYIEQTVESTPTAAHAEHYIGIINAKFLARCIIERCRNAIDGCYYGEDSPNEILAETQAALSDLIVTSDTRKLHEIGVALVEKWRTAKEDSTAIRWPISALHEKFGHITDELIFLAAQPSVGKTAFSIQMLVSLARHAVPCSMLSLESSKEKIVQRMIAQITPANTLQLRRGGVAPQAYENARMAAESLKDFPFHVTSKPMTLEQIRAWAMREKSSHGSRFFSIDNLKHVRCKESFKNRFDLFARLSLGMKEIRDDIGAPLMCLHHTNAEDQLAWSADILRDADVVAMMTAESQDVVNFAITKQREGATGMVPLRFDKTIQTFFGIEQNRQPERNYADGE